MRPSLPLALWYMGLIKASPIRPSIGNITDGILEPEQNKTKINIGDILQVSCPDLLGSIIEHAGMKSQGQEPQGT